MSWLAELLEKNSGDPRERLELGEHLLELFASQRLPPQTALLNDLADLTVQWMSASNFKVALLAVEIVETALTVSGDVFTPFVMERVAAVVERLGDSKATVREAAARLLILLAYSPSNHIHLILEKLNGGFAHRQWLVRTGCLGVFSRLLETSGQELAAQTSRLIPTFCKLLSDPNAEVRECASKTLSHAMRVLGQTVENHIRNKQLLPEAKVTLLVARSREVSISSFAGASQPSSSSGHPSPFSVNAWNRASFSSGSSRPLNIERSVSCMFRQPRLPAAPGRVGREEEQENVRGLGTRQLSACSATTMRKISVTPLKPAGGTAGAVCEDDFRDAFTRALPKDAVENPRDLAIQMDSIRGILVDDKNDWDKRVNALKRMRALVVNGGREMEESLLSEVYLSEQALLVSVKDLRSQVCREACITVSFLCVELGVRVVRLCETLLPPLVQLIMNSAKVMSSSASIACQFIVKHVQNPKLISTILAGISSKSKEIRGQVLNLTALLLDWDTALLEKHIRQIVETIRSGLGDADPAARINARAAYCKLDSAFPKHAQQLFQSLDVPKQRALAGSVSQSSSSTSIVSEHDNLSFPHRPGAFGLQRQKAYFNGRSTSDIDPGAARRANAIVPSRRILQTGGSVASRRTPARLPPSRPIPSQRVPLSSTTPPSPGTLSQPTSRSTSPQSRIPNLKKRTAPMSLTPRRATGAVSRDASPRRVSGSELTEAIRRVAMDDILDGDGFLSPRSGSPRVDASALSSALALCKSSSSTDKREGVSRLAYFFTTGAVESSQLKRIIPALTLLIGENQHMLLSSVLDLLPIVVDRFGPELHDWLPTLFVKLFNKTSTEVLPQSSVQLKSTLASLREKLDVESQLIAICKTMKNPVNTMTAKTKEVLLLYVHELLRGSDQPVSLNNEDVRGALSRIFIWMDEPRNAQNRKLMDQFLTDLFHINEADYTALVDTLPSASRDYALNICHSGASATAAREGITEMTAQISDFVADRSSSLPPSSAFSASPAVSSRAPFSRNSNGAPSPAKPSSDLDSSDSFLYPRDSVTMHLMQDSPKQQEHINKMLHVVESGCFSEEEQLQSLSALLQMVSEGSFTLWGANFKHVILVVFGVIGGDGNAPIKRTALKLLSKMCLAQASRFYEFAEVSVLKVLSASATDSNTQVQHVADECARTLATHLPAVLVVRALNPIVGEDGEPRRAPAIKMLTRLIEVLEAEELLNFLKDVAPGVVQAFDDSNSVVRKSVVMCLATMHNKIGADPLRPFLVRLDHNKLRLVEVYVQRSQTASNHF